MAEKLILIKTLRELEALEAYLENKSLISFDTETTGVSKDSEIIGFSVSAETDVGYYVVLSYWDVAAQRLIYLETKSVAKRLLEQLQGKSLIMHNAVFDCYMVENNFKVALMPSVHTDTMILAHLLDENRSCGLKELGLGIFGEDANKEQLEMKESVAKNGGVLTKEKYELYKADADLIGRYGAKDAILTLSLFYHLVEQLYEQGLDQFFYEDESMPLLRGPTYELNTIGLSIDSEKLQLLKKQLEADCLEAKAYIYKEIFPHVKDKYPGTGKANVFNIGASQQRAWLLFTRLENDFYTLTKEGRVICKYLGLKLPYYKGARQEFLGACEAAKGQIYEEAKYNYKTKKYGRPKKIGDHWKYISCGKETLKKLAPKYKWVERYLEYAKDLKILNTYVEGIESRVQYGIIRPSFLQHGTTSGRYASRNPNFQNLPRDDKRVKAFVVSRPGNVFVGADYSQLEPRVFASVSQCLTLMECFRSGQDFYSVVGAPIFDKTDCSLFKSGKDSFAVKYPKLRDNAKILALATPYGRTAMQQSAAMGIEIDEAQMLIDRYFQEYPEVQQMMLDSHEMAKKDGFVKSLFGRLRRMPEALKIEETYGNTSHAKLPYIARNTLNLAMNHRVQSTAASIMNRAAILCWQQIQDLGNTDELWKKVKIVLQVHDELILEGPEELGELMAQVLKFTMETAVTLPGVDLIAEPKISKTLADLK